MNKEYIQLITDLKQNIVQSRYAAARLANKEQLLLYFRIGKIYLRGYRQKNGAPK
jgi:hypothetical protein